MTALTVQDTHNVHALLPVEPDQVLAQARAVLEDMPVAAIKIGLIGSVENAGALHALLAAYPGIPVVLDPILTAGGGTELANLKLLNAVRTLLLPLVTVLTPNSVEARRLAPEADTLEACAMALLGHGSRYVLITGGHEPTGEVINSCYGNNRLLKATAGRGYPAIITAPVALWPPPSPPCSPKDGNWNGRRSVPSCAVPRTTPGMRCKPATGLAAANCYPIGCSGPAPIEVRHENAKPLSRPVRDHRCPADPR